MGDLTASFSRQEFACKCGKCGRDTVDFELVTALQELRDYYNQIVTITSGCRCPTYNAEVGGFQNSQHILCRAADFVVAGVRAQEVQAYLSMKYSNKYGIGRYSSWTHFDTRSGPMARWDG